MQSATPGPVEKDPAESRQLKPDKGAFKRICRIPVAVVMVFVGFCWVVFWLLAWVLSLPIEAVLKSFGWDPKTAPDDVVSFRAQKYAAIAILVVIGCALVGMGISYFFSLGDR